MIGRPQTYTMEKSKNNSQDDVPDEVWAIIHEYLGVGGRDSQKAQLRDSVVDIYPIFVFMYSVLIVVGILSNLAVFVHILNHKLYKDATYSFMINGVVSDVVKCIFVLPISLYVLLVQNWILGELLCSFLPMLQDIPMHTTTLTFLLIAWDRYKMIRNPLKPRMPAFVCTIGTWLTAVCLVLPYPIYITYIDLGKYLTTKSFKGVGICIINLAGDMQEYMRGIFLVMYLGPLGAITYLYIRVSRELKIRQEPIAVMMFETRSRAEGRSRTGSHSTTTDYGRNSRGECDGISQYSRTSCQEREDNRARYDFYDNDLDIPKEKRIQKYLVSMVTMYAICLCPLMVLRLARLALVETYDNSAHFDITYTFFVWIAFIPTCSTPLLFLAWQMSRPAKERLRGYFRFSNRKLRQSCEAVITGAGNSTSPRASRRNVLIGDSPSDLSTFQQELISS